MILIIKKINQGAQLRCLIVTVTRIPIYPTRKTPYQCRIINKQGQRDRAAYLDPLARMITWAIFSSLRRSADGFRLEFGDINVRTPRVKSGQRSQYR
jgi:hypothetical protein